MKLINCIPPGMDGFTQNDRTYEFCEIFKVFLGKYATVQVAKFRDLSTNEHYYVSTDMVDSVFKLSEFVLLMYEKPYKNLTKHEKIFLRNIDEN